MNIPETRVRVLADTADVPLAAYVELQDDFENALDALGEEADVYFS